MATYRFAQVPAHGQRIVYEDGVLTVPDQPIIPFIEGDGTGPDIWRAAVRVFDAAVGLAYAGARKIAWMELFAGEKAFANTGEWLPAETIDACREFRVSIKGPLSTPADRSVRQLSVTLRRELDLFACIRPVRHFKGMGAPVKEPERLNIVIFRENTEDVYGGIEYAAGSAHANKLRDFLRTEFGAEIREGSAIGIKPMSEFASKRLIDMALRYALKHGSESVTLVHKGNIQKCTDGAFRDWGYEVARDRYAPLVVAEADFAKAGSHAKADAVIIRDRIADVMFQQLLLRPGDFAVIATPNLIGDFLSDAAAAQVGGVGMAPGGNVGDGIAVFEATHGTAPKYAGLDKINPGSVILSGVMMFEYLKWPEAAALIIHGIERALDARHVTYDLARLMPGSTEISTSAFGDAIIAGMRH